MLVNSLMRSLLFIMACVVLALYVLIASMGLWILAGLLVLLTITAILAGFLWGYVVATRRTFKIQKAKDKDVVPMWPRCTPTPSRFHDDKIVELPQQK